MYTRLITSALLEEAVHANHPHLNKNAMKTGSYVDGKKIEAARNNLASAIKDRRQYIAPIHKNDARYMSQTGNTTASLERGFNDEPKHTQHSVKTQQRMIREIPNYISSARQ